MGDSVVKLNPKEPRVQTLVRLNEELSRVIRASAKANYRSLAQEIQFRLHRDMDANDGR